MVRVWGYRVSADISTAALDVLILILGDTVSCSVNAAEGAESTISDANMSPFSIGQVLKSSDLFIPQKMRSFLCVIGVLSGLRSITKL